MAATPGIILHICDICVVCVQNKFDGVAVTAWGILTTRRNVMLIMSVYDSRIWLPYMIVPIWLPYMTPVYDSHIWLPYMILVYDSRIWLPIWLPYMTTVYDSHIWLPYMTPVYDSRIWLPYMTPVYDSRIWLPYMTPIYDSHIWLPTYLRRSCAICRFRKGWRYVTNSANDLTIQTYIWQSYVVFIYVTRLWMSRNTSQR